MYMNKKKIKALIIVLSIIFVGIFSSVEYYHHYVEDHSNFLIGLTAQVIIVNYSGQQGVEIKISADINSSNSLTKYDFNESNGLGLSLYSGKNLSDLNYSIQFNSDNPFMIIPYHIDNEQNVNVTYLEKQLSPGFYSLQMGPTKFNSDNGAPGSLRFINIVNSTFEVGSNGQISILNI